MAYKRTTRKTGNTTKTTRTYNTKTGRTRVTNTVKPTKSLTISRSVNKNGTVKTTRTYNNNGWITKSSSTSGTGIFKPKKIRVPKSTSSRSYSGGGRSRSRGGGGDAGGELFLILFALTIGAIWWVTKHLAIATWIILREFTVGLWGAAGLAVKQEEKNFKWYCKAAGYFVLYLWVIAVLIYWPMKYLLSDKTKEEVKPIPVVEIQEEKIEMPELNVIIPAIIESQQKE